jgi:putative endonuclease
MEIESYTVYILYSFKQKINYTGYTSNLIKRFKDHNVNNTKGFTTKYRPWIVLYTEEYGTRKEAMMREKFLKSGRGRAFVKEDIFPKYSILW